MMSVSSSPPKSFISGIGSYVPEKVLGNQELSQKVETSDEWIKTRTGISERRIATNNQATSDLAFYASKQAIESAKIEPNKIDLVIVATITPDMAFPQLPAYSNINLDLEKSLALTLKQLVQVFFMQWMWRMECLHQEDTNVH